MIIATETTLSTRAAVAKPAEKSVRSRLSDGQTARQLLEFTACCRDNSYPRTEFHRGDENVFKAKGILIPNLLEDLRLDSLTFELSLNTLRRDRG